MNPKQFIMNYIKNTSNPMITNLIQMAEKGNTQSIETFARNFFQERGRNFDKEFAEFKKNFTK